MESLALFLDRAYAAYHRPEYLSSDPLEYVHRYSDPMDQEAVALVSALLAYGNVEQIRASIGRALGIFCELEAGPAAFVKKLGRDSRFSKTARASFEGWVHRFQVGSDLVTLLECLAMSWRERGSLGAHFLSYLDAKDPHIGSALDHLIADWRSAVKPKMRTHGFNFFLTSPSAGSVCKRWCMFLRWMGRSDEIDPGLWGVTGTVPRPRGMALRPNQLILPLDTHTGRICQSIGLTQRKSLNWKGAVEITSQLRSIDPEDPVKYDFALSRLGILDLLPKTTPYGNL